MNEEISLRAYVMRRLQARFLTLLVAVSLISCGAYFFAIRQSNRHQLLRSSEIAKQVLLQAFDAGDPNLTVAYLKSTIEQGNFYSVEVRDKAAGASLFGPLTSTSRRYFAECSVTDLGSRYGAELMTCRRMAGSPELIACVAFVLAIALVAGLGIRFVQKELSDWSDGLTQTLDRMSSLSLANLDEAERSVRAEPIREVAGLHRRIVQILADSRKVIELEAAAKISAQVAHDIQSPLAALEIVSGDGGERDKGLMVDALSRIRGIVDDLRRKEKDFRAPATPVDVCLLARAVMAEKRAQYRSRGGLVLELAADGGEGGFVLAEEKELARIVSNLLNNSVEALPDSRGNVLLEVAPAGGMVEIRVSDDGRGIPVDLLPRLGQEGATFGKSGGSGLGLSHARKTVEAWGGRLTIENGKEKGALVRVSLPAHHAGQKETILIDDDPLVRKTWGFASRRANRTFRAFESVDAFIRELDAGSASASSEIFLDCDLGDGERGESWTSELHRRGCHDVSLATGHDPESLKAVPYVKRIVGKSPPW